MDVFGDIYRKSIHVSERNIRRDGQYRRANNQMKQYYQTLCDRLSGDDMDLLDKLILCYDSKTERAKEHYFKVGFQTGHTVAVELLK